MFKKLPDVYVKQVIMEQETHFKSPKLVLQLNQIQALEQLKLELLQQKLAVPTPITVGDHASYVYEQLRLDAMIDTIDLILQQNTDELTKE